MAKTEERRFQRIRIDLPVTVTINNTDEYEGRLINMSPGNLAVQVETNAIVGDAGVVRIKGLDVIEGTVARTFPDGFALSFRLSKKRRAIITEKLMLHANQQFSHGLEDRRRSPRHHEGGARTVCRLDDGSSLFVKVLDRSVEAVRVDAARRPPIGSPIHVGRQHGVVTRHTPRGFVVVFDAHREEENRNDGPVLRAV